MRLLPSNPRPFFTLTLTLPFLLPLLATPNPAPAQPAPTFANADPIYLRRGESKEVTLNGQNLTGTDAIALPAPRGVTASLVPATKPTDPPRVKLSADADAPLGDRELHLITPNGVTPPLAVTIGQWPAVVEKEPNHTPDAAQPLPLPASVLGKIDTPGDADCFRFEAKKGQHLIFDAHAARLGSALEPVLTLHDTAGRELPHATEDHAGDPMLIFDAPADGPYVLQVRDLRYRGGGDYAYRIDAGEIPYVESLSPATGSRGRKVEISATGHNLEGGQKIVVDLTNAAPGPLPLRARTPAGLSNEISFFVTDTPPQPATNPATYPASGHPDGPAVVAVPSEISGVLAREGEEQTFPFRLLSRQQITLAVTARRLGSPLDALLTLKTAAGDVIEQSNGSASGSSNGPAGSEARIARALDAGEYLATLRDLAFGGGPSYAYRLSLAAGNARPDFSVRFLPDAVRVPRGGSAKGWCEVTRSAGFKGAVTVAIEGLPPGVKAGIADGPVTISENASGIFAFTAAADAPLGTFPIQLRAVGDTVGVARTGEPELKNRVVQQAYVTVTASGPLGVDAIAAGGPEFSKEYARELAEIQGRLDGQTPQLEAAQLAWEKQFQPAPTTQAAAPPASAWKMLEAEKLASAASAPLTKQPDGIVEVGGQAEQDTYTFTATSDVKGVVAVRLDALADSSLPAGGPGRAPNGNFVLSHFTLTAAPKSDPAKAQAIAFASAAADFEQANYPAASAIGAAPGGGWAVSPELGKSHSAVFRLAAPVGFEGGTLFTFALDQQFGSQHVLGRFRLSVSADPKAGIEGALPAAPPPLPAAIRELVKTPAGQRTAEQKAKLAEYYRSIAPELAADRSRREALRQALGPYVEIARLEAMLAANAPQLDAERAEWEKTALAGGWVVAEVSKAEAGGGVTLTREGDGSLIAAGPTPPTNTYTIVAIPPLRQITAVRLEALPDERLPGNGPGRMSDGNFILTGFKLNVKAGKDPKATTQKADPGPIEFASAKADFEQQGFSLSGVVGGPKDAKAEAGWAVMPNTGRPLSAVFLPKSPIDCGPGGATLTFSLEQLSSRPGHTIGRFRLWLNGSPDPQLSPALPPEVVAALKVPAGKRNDDQKAELTAYYRATAPSLEGARRRLAELRGRSLPLPITVARNKAISLPVPIARAAGFAGEVQITLEGFSSGRDATTRQPAGVAKSFTVAPLVLRGSDCLGKLSVKVNGNCEAGTRAVILKAETKIGTETHIQYSPAFWMTVTEK